MTTTTAIKTLTSISTDELLHTAELAHAYIQSKAIETEHGRKYSLEGSANSDPYFDEISLYSGSAGIIHFLLHFYNVTEVDKYLAEAEAAFPYIAYRWREARDLSLAFSPWTFTSGYVGVAFAIAELYKFSPREDYRVLVEEIVEAILEAAQPSEDGIGAAWTNSFGIVADSGTFLYLLHAVDQFNRDDWRDKTVEAGRILLNKGIDYDKGGRYFEGSSFGGKIIPGFSIGAGGVAYTLLKLYKARGDEVFLKATEGVKDFYHAIYEHDGDTITIAHDLPNEEPVH